MGKYTFYKDEKIVTWERTCFVIEAETVEQAQELAKMAISDDVEEVGNYEYSELLSDCREYNIFQPDSISPTIEIYDNDFEIIIDNRLRDDVSHIS